MEERLQRIETTLARIEGSLAMLAKVFAPPAQRSPGAARSKTPCAHLGQKVDQVECLACDASGKIRLSVYECATFGRCTIGKRVDGVAGCCRGCEKYEAR